MTNRQVQQMPQPCLKVKFSLCMNGVPLPWEVCTHLKILNVLFLNNFDGKGGECIVFSSIYALIRLFFVHRLFLFENY